MSKVKGLQPLPLGHQMNFKPSAKQFELWNLLEPNRCNKCGGTLYQKPKGLDSRGNMIYKVACSKCQNENIPQVILAGGAAGGGKSYVSSAWLIKSCIQFPDIRACICRRTLKSLKESTLVTIKKVCRDWGIVEDVNYKYNGLEGVLTFYNGSTITLKELSPTLVDPDYTRLGSSEFTISAVDEAAECEARAIEVLQSRLRWNIAETFGIGKLLLTCNPSTNWIRDRFVQDEYGNPAILREGDFYCPFSVLDNPDEAVRNVYRANLERIQDPKLRAKLLYGQWDYEETNDAACYWKFDGSKHLIDGLKEKVYNPLLPIILSFDFNTFPYMSCIASQIDYEHKYVYVLEEIVGKPEDKENNTPKFAQKIRQKYLSEKHTGGLVISGDPAGLQKTTVSEEGVNNYSILMSVLNNPILRPQKKLLRKQPSQITRLEFVNELLQGYDGWNIQIDLHKCRHLTDDLVAQKRNSDGTKEKKKMMDSKNGVKYEKYGHFSDCLDYLLVQFLSKQWQHFTSSQSSITTISKGSTTVYQAFDY